VVKALSLLELAPEVQGEVDAGRLSPAAGYEVSKLESAEAQREVAGRIVREGLTRDQAADAVREKARLPRRDRPSTGQLAQSTRGRSRAEYRLDDGTRVSVAGPAARSGQGAVITALEAALGLARQEEDRIQAA
jgi:hypothetical protein